MADAGGASCVDPAGRASNEQLGAWLRADARSDSQSLQQLFGAVTPLLFAFFEGQLPERKSVLNVLVLDTLIDVYRRRASYDPSRPFRAWLLGLARTRLVNYVAHPDDDGCTAAGEPDEPRHVADYDVDGEITLFFHKLVQGQAREALRVPALANAR
ncbi:hypothetical protein EYV96_03890 [Dyella terrae]|uniref:Sigma-70 family RNA polymerase sigma factor n=2 Tax=Dyella TaxID=231454 RepID=A0A4V6NA20_9GAMM|nr:hypothetical protein EYV96_03890 [Dyella terrae]TCI13037.1 hypothetical protein EZM97_06975 [Dyella soli]